MQCVVVRLYAPIRESKLTPACLSRVSGASAAERALLPTCPVVRAGPELQDATASAMPARAATAVARQGTRLPVTARNGRRPVP